MARGTGGEPLTRGGGLNLVSGGEVAGLPELEKLFAAVEQAGEDGGDEGVKSRRQQDAMLPRGLRLVAQAGGLVAQRGRVRVHSPAY